MARSVIFVLFLATLALAQDATSESEQPKYSNLRNRVHVFFDSVSFSQSTPQQLSDKVKTTLTNAKVDFENIQPMNFESGDYLSAYVDITLPTAMKYDQKGDKSNQFGLNRRSALQTLKGLEGVLAVQDQKNVDYAASVSQEVKDAHAKAIEKSPFHLAREAKQARRQQRKGKRAKNDEL